MSASAFAECRISPGGDADTHTHSHTAPSSSQLAPSASSSSPTPSLKRGTDDDGRSGAKRRTSPPVAGSSNSANRSHTHGHGSRSSPRRRSPPRSDRPSSWLTNAIAALPPPSSPSHGQSLPERTSNSGLFDYQTGVTPPPASSSRRDRAPPPLTPRGLDAPTIFGDLLHIEQGYNELGTYPRVAPQPPRIPTPAGLVEQGDGWDFATDFGLLPRGELNRVRESDMVRTPSASSVDASEASAQAEATPWQPVQALQLPDRGWLDSPATTSATQAQQQYTEPQLTERPRYTPSQLEQRLQAATDVISRRHQPLVLRSTAERNQAPRIPEDQPSFDTALPPRPNLLERRRGLDQQPDARPDVEAFRETVLQYAFTTPRSSEHESSSAILERIMDERYRASLREPVRRRHREIVRASEAQAEGPRILPRSSQLPGRQAEPVSDSSPAAARTRSRYEPQAEHQPLPAPFFQEDWNLQNVPPVQVAPRHRARVDNASSAPSFPWLPPTLPVETTANYDPAAQADPMGNPRRVRDLDAQQASVPIPSRQSQPPPHTDVPVSARLQHIAQRYSEYTSEERQAELTTYLAALRSRRVVTPSVPNTNLPAPSQTVLSPLPRHPDYPEYSFDVAGRRDVLASRGHADAVDAIAARGSDQAARQTLAPTALGAGGTFGTSTPVASAPAVNGPLAAPAAGSFLAASLLNPHAGGSSLLASAAGSSGTTTLGAFEDPYTVMLNALRAARQSFPRLSVGQDAEERNRILKHLARGLQRMSPVQRRRIGASTLKRMDWGEVEGERDECCAVCQDDYVAEDKIAITPCKHMYHAACLDTWLQTPAASTCPMCRRDMAVLALMPKILDATDPGRTKDEAREMWMDAPADLVPARREGFAGF